MYGRPSSLTSTRQVLNRAARVSKRPGLRLMPRSLTLTARLEAAERMNEAYGRNGTGALGGPLSSPAETSSQ
jgi:hypothetical protein